MLGNFIALELAAERPVFVVDDRLSTDVGACGAGVQRRNDGDDLFHQTRIKWVSVVSRKHRRQGDGGVGVGQRSNVDLHRYFGALSL